MKVGFRVLWLLLLFLAMAGALAIMGCRSPERYKS